MRWAQSSLEMKVMELYDLEERFLVLTLYHVLELYDQKLLYDPTESYHEMPRYCRFFDMMKLDRVLSTMFAEC